MPTFGLNLPPAHTIFKHLFFCSSLNKSNYIMKSNYNKCFKITLKWLVKLGNVNGLCSGWTQLRTEVETLPRSRDWPSTSWKLLEILKIFKYKSYQKFRDSRISKIRCFVSIILDKYSDPLWRMCFSLKWVVIMERNKLHLIQYDIWARSAPLSRMSARSLCWRFDAVKSLVTHE